MGKKISAKALASLYPSTQWRTRNVINSAVTKVQKAYDEEFQRLQSVQQTYQSVINFTNIAGEAYGSFRKAKMAGYEGNMFKYGTEPSEVQGVWIDKYKTFNKQVMDESDNKLTLNKLYKKLKKQDKSNTVKNLAEQFKVSTEVTGKDAKTTSSGISDLITYYNEGGKPKTTEPSTTEPKTTEPKKKKGKGLLGLFKGKSEEKFTKFGTNPRTGDQDKYRLDEDGTKIWQSDVEEEAIEANRPTAPKTLPTDEDDYSFEEEEEEEEEEVEEEEEEEPTDNSISDILRNIRTNPEEFRNIPDEDSEGNDVYAYKNYINNDSIIGTEQLIALGPDSLLE